MNRTRTSLMPIAALLGVGALLVGCSGDNSAADPPVASSAPATISGTIEFWHFFTGREADAIASVVKDFEKANPGVTVDIKANQDDGKMQQAISAGQRVDVGLSYSTDIVGKFCGSGAFVDLTPYITRDKVDLNALPSVVRSYTEFDGKRCAMPMLADTYGLYYNKTLLAKAGYTQPPKTISELTEMAKKLTVRDASGKISVAGFVPLSTFYENAPAHWAPSWGAQWLKPDGTSAIGSDPAWRAMLTWQKSLVDWYGYDDLQRFTAGLGQEFSPDNAFETGKVAMMIDGEYREAFIKSDGSKVDFGTAPFPVADDKSQLYGGGYITGNIIGIGRGSANPEAAWALIKYLTTDPAAVAKLADGIGNVPTLTAAVPLTKLSTDPTFRTFLDIFANPNSATTPASPNGGAYQQTLSTFIADWEAGKQTDLAGGLAAVDKQINDGLQLGANP